MKQNNEIQIKYIREAVDKNLGENKVKISNFFKQILSEGFDCVVFVSRRCYIIFLIFSILEKWEYKNVFVCTDLGVFANRDKIHTCKKIAIVDDVGYTGVSLRNVLSKVKGYVSRDCEIVAIMYAMNKRNAERVIKKPLFNSKKHKVKSRLWLTELQCKQLSVRLVNTILESGFPYTTIVYPLIGKWAADIDDKFTIYGLNTNSKSKWKTQYLEISETKENRKVLSLGDYSTIRTYKKGTYPQIVAFLPFIFLKSIKAKKVDMWYKQIAKTFLEIGYEEMAKEIYNALAIRGKLRADALVYLASFFSCFCSKALADLCELKKYIEEYSVDAEKSFEGSFSAVALRTIKECDKEVAKIFYEKLFVDNESIEDIFLNNETANKSKLDIALTKYIHDESEGKNIFETTCMIYSWLKGKDSIKYFKKGEPRAISIDDIVYILKKEKQYKERDILLAEIECWDLGIATYRFYFDRRRGLIAKCTAGEMSTTLEMVKYQYIIQKFYDKRYSNEEPYINMNRDTLLNSIIEETIKEGKYTESEMANFRKILEERKGSLLGMLI